MTTLETAYVASPVAVDVRSFDPLWPTGDHDSSSDDAMLFAEMAMPLKHTELTVLMNTDEDAWLFAGDKLGVAVRDIQITQATTSDKLTIQVPCIQEQQHHMQAEEEEEDATTTSVLMAPMMGSPVDVLDAMTAFMVDHVDPFQEVVFTSDDEPMSPAAASSSSRPARGTTVNSRMTDSGMALAEARRLAKLRASVAHLEKMYFARCHGNAVASDAVDVHRVKMVRALERLQRVGCNIARENYAFRAGKMTQRVREELLLHEMAPALKGVVMNDQIEQCIADKMCSNVIMTTARRAAEAAMGLAHCQPEELLGWHVAKSYEPATSLLSFTATKEMPLTPPQDFESVTTNAWDGALAKKYMKNYTTKTTCSHVIKQLSEDAVLMALDSVVTDADAGSVRVARDVCVAFRVRSATGMLLGITSIPPSLFVEKVHPVDGIEFVEFGVRWMQLTNKPESNSFVAVSGAQAQRGSRAAAEATFVDLIDIAIQWERRHVGAAFNL